MARLAHEEDKTIILTTHQLEMAQQLCDRVAIMRAGRVAADLPVSELLGRFRRDRYRIVLDAPTDLAGVPLPDEVSISHADGTTILTAASLEDRDLYQLLARLGERGLPLRSVSPVERNLEDAFLELVRAAAPHV